MCPLPVHVALAWGPAPVGPAAWAGLVAPLPLPAGTPGRSSTEPYTDTGGAVTWTSAPCAVDPVTVATGVRPGKKEALVRKRGHCGVQAARQGALWASQGQCVCVGGLGRGGDAEEGGSQGLWAWAGGLRATPGGRDRYGEKAAGGGGAPAPGVGCWPQGWPACACSGAEPCGWLSRAAGVVWGLRRPGGEVPSGC